MTSFFISALLGIAAVQASPTLFSRQSITELSASGIDAFTPYTHFAGAAYCNASVIKSWNCGANCASNPDFKLVASGGGNNSSPNWFVGYDSSLKTVVVAHQGTDLSKIQSLVTDANAFLGGLNASLFPGISANVEVHQGFRNSQSQTASDILSSVQSAFSQYGTNSVTMVGHSLGAATALLDSVYLHAHLPNGTKFQSILYGLPRVGNQAFANYVDANLNVTHINNKNDPIPIMPSRSLGYQHPSGEVHIRNATISEWASCPGQENTNEQCTDGTVSTIASGNLSDHNGPYNGINITCSGK